MTSSIVLLILAAGVPYYLLFERVVSSKSVFILSWLLLLGAIGMSYYVPNAHDTTFVIISFVSALFSFYKATKTTNFYKLGYYLIFVNAPFFMLFEEKGALYSGSLLISLVGIYLVARFYEKHYASANYHYIRGIMLSTPFMGTVLSVYLVALALYPPFPNAIFFLSHIVNAEMTSLWYIVVITLFFANYHLAIRVMKDSVFGRPNSNIHYVDLNNTERFMHILVTLGLLALSAYGIKELLL